MDEYLCVRVDVEEMNGKRGFVNGRKERMMMIMENT